MIIKSVTTDKHSQFLNITQLVADTVTANKLVSGTVTVFVPHTTAAVTINENTDPDVTLDIQYILDRVVPWQDSQYKHNEGNTAAHLKASLIGSSIDIIVEHGKLQLGTWQGIYFCEFDGPRQRKVWIKLLGI